MCCSLLYCICWGKVSLTCKYVSHLRWQHRTNSWSGYLLLPARLSCFQIGRIRWASILYLSLFNTRRLNKFIRCSNISMGLLLNNHKAGISTNVDKEVKKAIVQFLKASNAQLSNGLSSLARNGLLEHFSWPCRQETQTHTILIWHIATCYCEITPPPPELELSGSLEQVDVLIHRGVVTKLSKILCILGCVCSSFATRSPYLMRWKRKQENYSRQEPGNENFGRTRGNHFCEGCKAW
jgi:hypothetical protein